MRKPLFLEPHGLVGLKHEAPLGYAYFCVVNRLSINEAGREQKVLPPARLGMGQIRVLCLVDIFAAFASPMLYST